MEYDPCVVFSMLFGFAIGIFGGVALGYMAGHIRGLRDGKEIWGPKGEGGDPEHGRDSEEESDEEVHHAEGVSETT